MSATNKVRAAYEKLIVELNSGLDTDELVKHATAIDLLTGSYVRLLNIETHDQMKDMQKQFEDANENLTPNNPEGLN
jgi:hypothetical protein